jgi:hypothetical protein
VNEIKLYQRLICRHFSNVFAVMVAMTELGLSMDSMQVGEPVSLNSGGMANSVSGSEKNFAPCGIHRQFDRIY